MWGHTWVSGVNLSSWGEQNGLELVAVSVGCFLRVLLGCFLRMSMGCFLRVLLGRFLRVSVGCFLHVLLGHFLRVSVGCSAGSGNSAVPCLELCFPQRPLCCTLSSIQWFTFHLCFATNC